MNPMTSSGRPMPPCTRPNARERTGFARPKPQPRRPRARRGRLVSLLPQGAPMGILDEAIRDHLELKRQRGANREELMRLEDEAFGPPSRPGEPDFPQA